MVHKLTTFQLVYGEHAFRYGICVFALVCCVCVCVYACMRVCVCVYTSV